MKFYHVDSFASELFRGNPAGVMILRDGWLDEKLMLNIAMENNMSETAFVLLNIDEQNGDTPHIRWFTPGAEVNLCGHATLAAAHVLFNHEGARGELCFNSRRGVLKVSKKGDLLELDFPKGSITKVSLNEEINCFNYLPDEVYKGEDDYLFVFSDEEKIRDIVCDLPKTSKIDLQGIIVTAKGKEHDFVSRYFGPKIGIPEDPVTGSAHTLMVPYWQNITGKTIFKAMQLSKRTGELFCEAAGDRVKIAGKAVTYLEGEIFI